MKFGNFDVRSVNFGTIRLDGGAMFGSIPKNLWAKRIEADQQNRIPLAVRSLLIRYEDRTILADVGMGDKWDEKARRIYAIENVPESRWGFKAEEITDILISHLHFDHSGALTRYASPGRELELAFPCARVWVQRANWENAHRPSYTERASYLEENFGPLAEGRLELVDGDKEIYPGLWVHESNGHTRGLQWVELKPGTRSIVYPSDLIPTAHHLAIPYHMGYDRSSEIVMAEKEELLTKAEKDNWIVVFKHDADTPAAAVGRDQKGHFAVKEAIFDL